MDHHCPHLLEHRRHLRGSLLALRHPRGQECQRRCKCQCASRVGCRRDGLWIRLCHCSCCQRQRMCCRGWPRSSPDRRLVCRSTTTAATSLTSVSIPIQKIEDRRPIFVFDWFLDSPLLGDHTIAHWITAPAASNCLLVSRDICPILLF